MTGTRKSAAQGAEGATLHDQPLAGIRVVDFSTLLPGPLATLMLAEAGAEVVKIEKPGGDELRGYEPPLGPASANFAMLNRGKRSVEINLKDPDAKARLLPLLATADVLVEQFRPGVMERLGLGYEQLRRENEGLIYCSISGFGADGPNADVAAHDVNYLAAAGVLDVAASLTGVPSASPMLVADIGGGTYPAVINVLMALVRRARTGRGCHIRIAMAESLYPFIYWALAEGFATGEWPTPGSGLLTGGPGSCRYGVWKTADGRHLSAAPIEERFWRVFCEVIGLDPGLRDDRATPAETRAAIAGIIAGRTAQEWRDAFAGKDACVAVVETLDDAVRSPAFAGLFERRSALQSGHRIPALPLPLSPDFLGPDELEAPALGEANADYFEA